MARILVVEDDQDIRALVVRRLQHAEHQVLGAANGSEAIAIIAEKGAPDLVVLDVDMPEMNGFELLELLRAVTGKYTLNAVFLSGHMEPEAINRGRELGGIYLTKPFVATPLLAAVDALILAEAQLHQPANQW